MVSNAVTRAQPAVSSPFTLVEDLLLSFVVPDAVTEKSIQLFVEEEEGRSFTLSFQPADNRQDRGRYKISYLDGEEVKVRVPFYQPGDWFRATIGSNEISFMHNENQIDEKIPLLFEPGEPLRLRTDLPVVGSSLCDIKLYQRHID